MFFLFKGFLLGFIMSTPVGPIAILCIRRTMIRGRLNGILTGLGAATADAFYGGVAAFGAKWISDPLIRYMGWFQFLGGIVLGFLAYNLFKSNKPMKELKLAKASGVKTYFSSILLTLSNPGTIFSFLAIFTMFQFGIKDSQSALILTGGVFLGAVTWWLFLSTLTLRFHNLLSEKTIHKINVASATGLLLFAIVAFTKGAHTLFFQ
jgi:threonine/homoserine/homoserine lactone efflux protein